MSQPRPCEHCGTPVRESDGADASIIEPDGRLLTYHGIYRCRDVLRAQRDEAIRIGLDLCDGHPVELAAAEAYVAKQRAALEKLRGSHE